MAVVDIYVNSDLEAGTQANPAYAYGAQPFVIHFSFDPAAADEDGSVYRLAKNLNPNLILTEATIWTDGITSGTDWDLGLYKTNTPRADGAEINKDCFADGVDLSSAVAKTVVNNGLVTLANSDYGKRLFEVAGHTESTKLSGYDIALTANTVGSEADTIAGRLVFTQG